MALGSNPIIYPAGFLGFSDQHMLLTNCLDHCHRSKIHWAFPWWRMVETWTQGPSQNLSLWSAVSKLSAGGMTISNTREGSYGFETISRWDQRKHPRFCFKCIAREFETLYVRLTKRKFVKCFCGWILTSLSYTWNLHLCLITNHTPEGIWRSGVISSYIFRRFRKIAKKRLLASSYLSVRPHGTTRLPLDGLSWIWDLSIFRKSV